MKKLNNTKNIAPLRQSKPDIVNLEALKSRNLGTSVRGLSLHTGIRAGGLRNRALETEEGVV